MGECEGKEDFNRGASLQDVLREQQRLSVSRYIENNGIQLFKATKDKNLEGIIVEWDG